MSNQLTGATNLHQRAYQVLNDVCRLVGLDAAGAELLRLRSNAVFKLRAPIIVRVATAPTAAERLPAVLAVTRWLADRGFPTVRPADEIAAQPVDIHGATVTFWRYVPAADAPATTADLGRLLRDLHAGPTPPFPLRTMADPLGSIRATVQHHPGVLNHDDQTWLSRRIHDLSEAWKTLPSQRPSTLLHGDAWIDNLLRHQDGHVVLGDWDSVAIGPCEWDLIHSYHGERRFGLSVSDVDEFAAAYGYDLRNWDGYETLMQIRETYAIGIHIRNAPGDPFSRRELAHRLHCLQTSDTHTRWWLKNAH
ncbi:aminoglycoside phosphotransferase family protein [Actinomadura chibensis]|uniref:Aminoglycoside phosphotransferase family protein n=1 Tax=Actinomadura chibensis TaxID=392828 RepID=A0A5D0N904_9ACTN|nr:aminoglycoside phosphotransferase family protein [Actinomadura chibensis]TYB40787.1 aminoglycoside phosphotransferase family protein [Actinomadura chibensis]